jgi:hypothetical protein
MKSHMEIVALLLVAFLVAQPVAGYAGSSARLVPSGKVSVLDNGKEVNQFQSEMPLPQGIQMACNGGCVVQAKNLQLVVHDKAIFALIDDISQWDLTVNAGRVDFALRTEGKSISFHTPHDVIQTQQVIVPAGSEGLLRGHVTVTAKATELAVDQGAMQVLTRNGVELVEQGRSIVLAQAQMLAPPEDKGKDDPPDTAGVVPVSGSSAVATRDPIPFLIGGITLAILGGAVYLATRTEHNPVSPE